MLPSTNMSSSASGGSASTLTRLPMLPRWKAIMMGGATATGGGEAGGDCGGRAVEAAAGGGQWPHASPLLVLQPSEPCCLPPLPLGSAAAEVVLAPHLWGTACSLFCWHSPLCASGLQSSATEVFFRLAGRMCSAPSAPQQQQHCWLHDVRW